MKKTGLSLLIVLILAMGARAEIIFQRADPKGDDYGQGTLVYPGHEVYQPGLFDLLQFTVEEEREQVRFDFKFGLVSNPFRAPEGFFHQRLEVFINTGLSEGSEIIPVGEHRFQTAPGCGWDIRLAVAPFGETRLYRGIGENMQAFSEGISCSVRDDGQTITVQVQKALLPEINRTWNYYVLVGAFDGLAAGFWRQQGPGAWDVGGEGPPIFDLLAPRWGSKNQKIQLAKGILYPVSARRFSRAWFALAAVLGVVVWGGFFLWRWIRVRT